MGDPIVPGDGSDGGGGGGGANLGPASVTALGPNPVANHGASVTITLYGHGFGRGLRVFFRSRSSDTEIQTSNIRVIDSTHAHAEVILGTKAASWYVSVAGNVSPRSAEIVMRVIGDDYPADLKAKPCDDSSSDSFGLVARMCESFVAWRLTEDGATFASSDGVSYVCSDGRTLTQWSHARCWDEAAAARGFGVDRTPRVGSIAQWNDAGVVVDGAPSGHVAYVAAVFLDTQEVLIEEYDADEACTYSSRRVRIDQVEHFIHIHDA
jgi:hypothetical protein